MFVAGDVTTPEPPALLDLLDGPLVESTNDLVFLFVDSTPLAPCSRRRPGAGLQVEQGVLLEGRRADPDEPDEVALSETAARNLGLGVGDTLAFGSLDVEQAETLLHPGRAADAPSTGRSWSCESWGSPATASTRRRPGEAGTALTVTTPAFWEEYGDEIGVGARSHMVRLVDEPDAVERFTTPSSRPTGTSTSRASTSVEGELLATDSISVITAALVAVALVIAAAGVVWIGSATGSAAATRRYPT